MVSQIIKKGDVNAFWALFADNLSNFLVIIGVCTFVFNMDASIVFSRIVPGLGIAIAFGAIIYFFMARRLAKKTGRSDVTALPYGISTPVMFVYLFGVIGPIYWSTQDALLAWQIGIAAGLIGSIVNYAGVILGPFLQRAIPRAGMLGTLSGIAITFIASVAFARIYEDPVIGFIAFSVVLWGLVGRYKLPMNLPAGLVAIVIGVILALAFGRTSIDTSTVAYYPPVPWIGDIKAGISALLARPELLAVLIPVQLYNMIETMNNVEAAKSAGDDYSVSACQFVDGTGTALGALFGSPFPTTVYIGHPAYKSIGAGGGYALLTAIVFLIGAMFGLIALLSSLVPMVVVAPFLVFVGLSIVATSFNVCEKRHAVAITVAFLPHLSEMMYVKWNALINSLRSMGLENVPSLAETASKMHLEGAFVEGHTLLGYGAIITGMLWGGLAAYLIDRDFLKSAMIAIACTLLTAIGVMHAPSLGNHIGPLTYGYALLTAVLIAMHMLQPEQISEEDMV